jgi:hypothetical protein
MTFKAQQKRINAEIKGLEAQILFWQSQTKAKTKTMNDATIFPLQFPGILKKLGRKEYVGRTK